MADDDARARRTTKATTGAPAKKAAVRKAPGAKAPAKKAAGSAAAAPVRKTAASKAAAKKVAPDAAPAKKAPARKAPARKAPAPKAAVKKTAGRKAPTAKAPAARKRSEILSPPEPRASRLRLAAEETFDDDWDAPAAPPREDPAARIRGVLRAAAARIEGREEPPASPPAPPTAPRPAPAAAAPPPDEPVTRVLVAPTPPEPDVEGDEELEEEATAAIEVVEEEDGAVEEEEGDWSPPEVLEAPAPPPPPPPPPPRYTPPPPPPVEPPPTVVTTPSPPEEPPKRAGAGTSILAILLALVVPVIGAIIGFVLANRGRRRGASLSGLARVVSILALVAWLVGGGVFAYATLRDEGVDYSQLKVGDCFDSSATNEVRGVDVKPCEEPHNSEIFFIVTHPAGPEEPYPGKDALVQFAADACLGQPLTDYLGVPLEQSQLKDFEIVPQQSAWEDGRRVLVCGLDTGGQGRITGSVKGTGR